MKMSFLLIAAQFTCLVGCGTEEGEDQLNHQIDKQAVVPTEALEDDVLSKDLWAPDDPESGFATSRPLLYYPRITRLSGEVVERRLMKRFSYYLVDRDGKIYALDTPTPPTDGLNRTYDATGVRLVASTLRQKQLDDELKESLLPGQKVPKSPIECILYDVTLTPVADASASRQDK